MKLELARMYKGLSVSELARRSGVDKSLISKIESGERNSFRPDTMTKLAAALGLKEEQLGEIDEFERLLQSVGGAKAARESLPVL